MALQTIHFWVPTLHSGEIFTISASKTSNLHLLAVGSPHCAAEDFWIWKSPIRSEQPTRSPSQNYVLWALESTKKQKKHKMFLWVFWGSPWFLVTSLYPWVFVQHPKVCLPVFPGLKTCFHFFYLAILRRRLPFYLGTYFFPDGWLNHHLYEYIYIYILYII